MADQQPSKEERRSKSTVEEQKHDNCKTENTSGSNDAVANSSKHHKSGGPGTTENAGECVNVKVENKVKGKVGSSSVIAYDHMDITG